MKLTDKAREFLEENHIEIYTINPDGMIDVDRDVEIKTIQSKLPVKFGRVTGYFDCVHCQLTSLEGAPSHVNGNFYCQSNHLTSLEYAPGYISGNFSCNNNRLTSLHDIHKHIKEVNGWCYFHKDNIKDSVLGLLLIKGIKKVYIDNDEVAKILNRHLCQGRAGVIDAQQELLDAGLDEFARL